LTAYFDSYEIDISKAQRQKLQGLLSNALSANVVFSPDNVLTDHDIRLSLDMHEQPRWHRALYTLDHVPEFISVSLPDAAKSGLVGQMQGQYQYRQPDLYPVDSVSNALTMLRNGRLDSVIDVRSNEFFYRVKSQDLNVESLRQSAYLFVDFRSKALADKFDATILQYSNITDTKAVDPNRSESNKLTLIRIAKVFDAEKQRLVASPDEVEASEWLRQKMPEFDIDLVDTNSVATLGKLRRGENVCALNVRKTEERSKVGIFTLPSRVFLSLKLFVNKTLPSLDYLQQLQQSQGYIDLSKVLLEYPQGLVALPENSSRYDEIEPNLQRYLRANPNRVITVRRQNNFKGYQLLKQNRVDYLVEFPTTLKSFMTEQDDHRDFDSFDLKSPGTVVNTYTICTNSAVGERAAAAINRLILADESRKKLVSIYTKGLTSSDTLRFNRAIEEAIAASDL